MRRRLAIILGAIALGLVLSACAYKPLKAPCGPDEGGQPLAYAEPSASPEPFASIDACGPMQPI
ncbi:hypothetical protein BHK69_31040 (plasmid) [Bosea vaviloviae]|uniref:Lipoprotein n=1 Tax=Bosea vaviloviae TaxID=1526658 RepID=A0A1D7UCM5_9HYPH|nr:hypothetical protein BHK69_31040 [Bosea vaviloviae]